MKMKIVTVADLPYDLANKWLQHLRDFDSANPGCHFEVLADAPGMPFDQVVKTLAVDPALSVIDVMVRGKS